MKNFDRSAIMLLTICSATAVQAAECGDISAKIVRETGDIQGVFSRKTASAQADFERQMKDEQDNMPKPSKIEAVLDFKIDIKMKTQAVKIDLPSVTMKDQKMSMDVPQVTMKQQKWAFDVPETWMGQQCIPGIPETVCKMTTRDIGFGIKTDIPECLVRAGKEMCTDVPQIRMSRKEAILGVPEIKMDRTDWVMGVPEFKMETQEIKFDLPEITVREVKGSIKQAQEKMESKSIDFKNSMSANGAKLKAEIEQSAAGNTIQYLACQKDNVVSKRGEILAKIDQGIAIVKASYDKAVEVKATEISNAMGDQLKELIARRNESEINMNKAISDFDEKQNAVLRGGIGALNSTIKVQL